MANATIATEDANVATTETTQVRIRRDLQRRAKVAAAIAGQSLEAWLNDTIAARLEAEGQ